MPRSSPILIRAGTFFATTYTSPFSGTAAAPNFTDVPIHAGGVAWYGDYPDASTFTDKYLSTSLQNDADWKSPEFDALCAKAAKEGDAVARGKLLSEAEALLDNSAAIVPVYHYVNISASRDNVEGVRANPRNLVIFKRVKVNKPGK